MQQEGTMASPELVEQINRIIWMEAPVVDDLQHHYTKELPLSGSKIVWSIVNGKVASLQMTDPSDHSSLLTVDITDPDLASTLEMLQEKDNQHTPVEELAPIPFWGGAVV
jgi:hypothetical protein